MSDGRLDPAPLIMIAVPVGFLCVSVASLVAGAVGLTGRPHRGSRGAGEAAGLSSDAVREIMRELDPVDSLYFDVSVARHAVEEGEPSKAKKWLDQYHALGELDRCARLGLLPPDLASWFRTKISEAADLIDKGRTSEAFNLLCDLQAKAGEVMYEKVAQRFKEKGLDPPERIDAKFEPMRAKKVEEWKAKGYPLGLIEKALRWAEEWARGIARRFIRDPELAARVAEMIYPEALAMSEKWLEAMGK
jgi:hypothetical protein